MEDIIKGIGLLLEFQNILLILSGVLIGVLVGALPGLSSPMAIALLIPFTISLDPVAAIAMMAALYCAGTFGGSITAILINAPGAPPAVATALDGYPMAKNGEPGRALGLAAVSSVFGGIFSLIIFIFAAPLLAKLALEFGPAEYLGLAVFALSNACIYEWKVFFKKPYFRSCWCVNWHYRNSSNYWCRKIYI